MGQYASVAQRVADCSNLDSSLSACRLAALDASTAGISKAASITSIESQDSHRTTRDCETSGSSEELETSHGLRTIRRLQQGSNSIVVLAEEASSGRPFAVKLVKRDACPDLACSEMLAQRCLLGNPHIISFKQAVLTSNHVAIVMEHACGGDLREYLERNDQRVPEGGLPESQARRLFQQIAIAIDYCHRLGIAHQDIKLENVLLDRIGSNPLVKLCDFGYSVRNEACAKSPVACSRAVGTPDYMAPELLLSPVAYNGKPADVWALGVLLYTLLTGTFPFWQAEDAGSAAEPNSRLRTIATRVVRAEYKMPLHISPAAQALLTMMLCPTVDDRATMEQVLQAPWYLESLPDRAQCLNSRLLQIPSSQRCASCPQSDNDLLRMTRRMS